MKTVKDYIEEAASQSNPHESEVKVRDANKAEAICKEMRREKKKIDWTVFRDPAYAAGMTCIVYGTKVITNEFRTRYFATS